MSTPCPKCGQINQPPSAYCASCGAALAPPPPPPAATTPPSGGRRGWWIAAVLSVAAVAAGVTAWALTTGSDGSATYTTVAAAAGSSTTEATTTTTVGSTTSTPPSSTSATTLSTTVAEPAAAPFEDEWEISSDQQRVLEEFGSPRTFTVLYGQDDLAVLEEPYHRLEYWDYHEMGVRFVFRDGAVVGTRETSMLGTAYDYPAVMPWWFRAGMTPAEVSDLLGGEPGATGVLAPEEDADLVMMVWDGVTAVTFEDGFLVGAQTAPVEVGG